MHVLWSEQARAYLRRRSWGLRALPSSAVFTSLFWLFERFGGRFGKTSVKLLLFGEARLGVGIGHGARAQVGDVYAVVHPQAYAEEKDKYPAALVISKSSQLVALGTQGPFLGLLPHVGQGGQSSADTSRRDGRGPDLGRERNS